MKIKRIKDDFGIVEYNGVEMTVFTLLTDGVKEGDYVLVHAGVAISKIEQEMAEVIIPSE